MIAGSQHLSAESLRERYRTNRGRRCEVCGSSVAYDRELPYCGRHETRRAGVLARGRKAGRSLPGLRPLMDRRKVTVAELAEETGVSYHHLSGVARCAKKASEECASLLAGALGVTVDELVGEPTRKGSE